MRWVTSPLIVLLLSCLTGCGNKDEERQLQAEAVAQKLNVLETQLQSLSERIDSCRTSIRDLDKRFADANFHVDQVPKLVRQFDDAKASLAAASDLLQIVSRKGDQLVVRGIVVADAAGNPRCLVSPLGMAVTDPKGQRVCEIQYDEKANAMTASLRGRKSNSVALYAGEDRAAIGAYDVRGNGMVGWAATVTPGGQVTAGKAER